MEGGNKYNINLEAGLDTKSNDMLVPVGDPKFQHNWQKYQGHYLPNSLRFEKNGWAAGWNVYDFKFDIKKLPVHDTAETSTVFVSYSVAFEDTGVYRLSVYDAEDSDVESYSILVAEKTKLIGTNTDISVNDNIFTGKVLDTPFILHWDANVKQFEIQSEHSMTVKHTDNSNYTSDIVVTDNTTAFDINTDIYIPTALSCNFFTSDFNFVGYSENVYNWGAYTFNGTKITTPEGVDVTTFVIVDHKIKFNYVYNVTPTLKLKFNVDKYYVAFDIRKVTDTSFTYSNFATDSDGDKLFNSIKSRVISEDKTLVPGRTFVDLVVQLPVWFSIKVNAVLFDFNGAMSLCDNVDNGDVALIDPSFSVYDRRGTYRLKSYNVYDSGSSSITEARDPNRNKDIYYMIREAAVVLDRRLLKHRFSAIIKLDDIVCPVNSDGTERWQPIKTRVSNEPRFAGVSYKFDTFWNNDIDRFINMLGSAYTISSVKYSLDDFFDSNDPFDWDRFDNPVYTEPDISQCRSIKLMDEDSEFDNTPDIEYIESKLDLAFVFYKMFKIGDYTLYSPEDSYKTYTELYDDTGKYIGGTYTVTPVDITTDDESFWPFKIVPTFNYKVQDEITGEWLTYENVFYVSSTGELVITQYDFAKLLLGEFIADREYVEPAKIEFVPNASRHRSVIKYSNNKLYDHDEYVKKEVYDEDDSKSKEFASGVWTAIYADKYLAPWDQFDYTERSEYDDTFDNYTDKTVVHFDGLKVDVSYPGIILKQANGVRTSNIIPYADLQQLYIQSGAKFSIFSLSDLADSIDTEDTFQVFHNNEDVTDLYDIGFNNGYGELVMLAYDNQSYFSGGKVLPTAVSSTFCSKSIQCDTRYDAGINMKYVNPDPFFTPTTNCKYMNTGFTVSYAADDGYFTIDKEEIVDKEGTRYVVRDLHVFDKVTGETYNIAQTYVDSDEFVRSRSGVYEDIVQRKFYVVSEKPEPPETQFKQYAKVTTETVHIDFNRCAISRPKETKDATFEKTKNAGTYNIVAKDDSKCWFKSVDIDKFNITGYETNGVQLISTDYKFSKKVDSEYAAFAIPVWGYAFIRMSYDALTKVEMFNTSKPVNISLLPDTNIPETYRNRLFIDRATIAWTTAKCVHIIDSVSFNGIPEDGSGASGFGISLTLTADNGFYYSKQILDDKGKPITNASYLPGICLGANSPSATEGNLNYIARELSLGITHKASVTEFIDNEVDVSLQLPDFSTGHKVIVDSQYQSFLPDVKIHEPDIDSKSQLVTVTDGLTTINYTFIDKKLLAFDDYTVTHTDDDNSCNYIVTYNREQVLDKDGMLTIDVDLLLKFNDCEATLCALSDKLYSLLSYSDGVIEFTVGDNTVVYDTVTANIVNYSVDESSVINTGDGTIHNIKAHVAYNVEFNAVLQGVYDGAINDSIVSFSYNDLSYEVSIADLKKLDASSVVVESTDIRDPDINHVKYLSTLKLDKDYQLVKQQWNTTIEVENYWWINSDCVLELTQSEFRLKRKNGELDDWNGDSFDVIATCKRSDIINSSMKHYFVCNQYNCTSNSMFVAISVTNDTVDFSFYKISDLPGIFTHINDISVPVRNKELGFKLVSIIEDKPELALCSYANITGTYIGSVAEWSNTIIEDKYLIIGCHVNNNFNQWALVFDIDKAAITLDKIIQGYGYVGLHGDLTGGQIPSYCFDSNYGFTDTVRPISSLDTFDSDDDSDDINKYQVSKESDFTTIYTSDEKVVGTAGQQWYYKQVVDGIVSHLTFNSKTGTFTKQLLPMTNKYTAIYKSPSFASSIVGDDLVKWYDMSKLFSFENKTAAGWFNAICGLLGSLGFLVYGPRFAHLVYLQQTLGQYAYVHYNTSKAVPDYEFASNGKQQYLEMDGKEKERQILPSLVHEYLFDKQTNKQSVSLAQLRSGGMSMWFSLIFSTLPAISAAVDNFQGDTFGKAMGNSALSFGEAFEDSLAENVSNVAVSNIKTVNIKDSASWSAVTAVKSLDMFYSTSDNQRVFAGPGFVEHQFVADCIAQSVTDFDVKGRTVQFTYLIKEVSEWITKSAQYAVDTIIDAAAITAGAVGGDILSSGLAATAVLGYTTARAINGAFKCASEALYGILDKLAAKVNGSSDAASIVAPHKTLIENKHKYGEKNETFMWPCFGITTPLSYSDEVVYATYKNTPWALSLNPVDKFSNWNYAHQYATGMIKDIADISSSISLSQNKTNKNKKGNIGKSGWTLADAVDDYTEKGDTIRTFTLSCDTVPFYTAACNSIVKQRKLPKDMTCIQGVTNFLPNKPFMNETVGVSDPVFTPSIIHDYIIDKQWDLAQCCTYGLSQWITVKDTKITNCAPSNIVVSDRFCGIATPYEAVEVKQNISRSYFRPWAVTPNALALNITGYNAVFDDKVYHAFDGVSNRIVSLTGGAGLQKNRQTFVYAIQVNDRFKRSNIVPATELQGDFESIPTLAIDTIDPVWQCVTVAAKEKGLEAGTVGEDKDAVRWAVPVFTESVSTLPAVVKTLTAADLAVVEGITSLVTAKVTDTNAKYKAPLSVDFAIGKNVYRVTSEYICSVQATDAGNVIKDIIPINGLTYLGASPTEAYFYSAATRCYYLFSGSTLTKVDMLERFRNIKRGYWDFVNQEVVMPSLMTAVRLDKDIKDNDSEIDNIVMPVFSQQTVSGELSPPIPTIFNDRSWFNVISLPSGLAYQGPNRVIINRSIFCDYMLNSIKSNIGKWTRLSRDKYNTDRKYTAKYESVNKLVPEDKANVTGWTYNPFVLVTSPLGLSEEQDCMFEWELTFCWPVEMDLLYGANNFAVVNISGETMTQGGKLIAEPVHVFLTKDLFTRSDNYGYYTFRYQSKNGAGNRERLRIWSDQYIAISSISCDVKVITTKRTQQLTQQLDVLELKEL